MKQNHFNFASLFGCALWVALSSSCASEMLDDSPHQGQPDATEVQFSVFNESVTPLVTRNVDPSEATHLLVLDVSGQGTQVYTRGTGTATDVDTKAVADPLTLTLTHGAHTLYFVAASTAFASYDAAQKTVTWDAATAVLRNCWAEKMVLQVSGSTASQTLTLPVRVGVATLEMTDVIPSGVDHFDLSFTAGSWTLDLTTMQGGDAGAISRRIDIKNSLVGQSASLGLYTFTPEEGTTGVLTATAYDASDQAITSHQINGVTIQEACQTNYKGMFFKKEVGMAFTLSPTFGKNEAGSF